MTGEIRLLSCQIGWFWTELNGNIMWKFGFAWKLDFVLDFVNIERRCFVDWRIKWKDDKLMKSCQKNMIKVRKFTILALKVFYGQVSCDSRKNFFAWIILSSYLHLNIAKCEKKDRYNYWEDRFLIIDLLNWRDYDKSNNSF